MAKTPLKSNTEHGGHHITQPKEYIKVFLALTVLMILTIFVAVAVQVPDIGPLPGVWMNNFIAILIATLKALLVIMVFMGVKYSTSLTKLWVVAGFLTFGIMFFIMADNLTRKYEPAPSWTGNEGSAFPRDLNPLDQNVPPDEFINTRPR